MRGEPLLEKRNWEFWASKSAPARLVITELFNGKFAFPVQVTVPPFSKDRPSDILEKLLLPTKSVAPGAIVKRPVPETSPAVQVVVFVTVTAPEPLNVPLRRWNW